jgi:valyl-tRNA synthetase
MPKDRAEVQDQYKIGGGSLNEYEYEQSKGAYEEQSHPTPEGAPVEGLRGAAEPGLPENVAERIRQVEERAHEIVERRRAKQGGAAASKGAAKKSAGKAAAKKPAKAGAKKAAAGKKGAAKKGGARR